MQILGRCEGLLFLASECQVTDIQKCLSDMAAFINLHIIDKLSSKYSTPHLSIGTIFSERAGNDVMAMIVEHICRLRKRISEINMFLHGTLAAAALIISDNEPMSAFNKLENEKYIAWATAQSQTKSDLMPKIIIDEVMEEVRRKIQVTIANSPTGLASDNVASMESPHEQVNTDYSSDEEDIGAEAIISDGDDSDINSDNIFLGKIDRYESEHDESEYDAFTAIVPTTSDFDGDDADAAAAADDDDDDEHTIHALTNA